MALHFLLSFQKPKHIDDDAFIMNGGPLTRHWTMTEWNDWLDRQPPKERPFYIEWAKEATSKPYTDIPRELGN